MGRSQRMKLYSMTGFAEAAGGVEGLAWRWEARSVNGRGLDLRLRLPEGWEALEPELRRRVGQAVSRGSVTIGLKVEHLGASAAPAVDPEALSEAVAALVVVRDAARAAGLEVAPVSAERLLQIAGAQSAEPQRRRAPDEAAMGAALDSLDALIAGLAETRAREGLALGLSLGGVLDAMEAEARAARAAHAAQTEAAPERLRARVAALTGAGATPPPERLAAELALLAVKADVAEELDRLDAHLAAARSLLARGGAVGRELDFLTQEFNREANTLCAKAESPALTEAGLAIKVLIDRLREQAQNLQ